VRVSFLAPLNAFRGSWLVRLLFELLVGLPIGLHVTFLTVFDGFRRGWLIRLLFGLLVELLVELLVGLHVTFVSLVGSFGNGSPDGLLVRCDTPVFHQRHNSPGGHQQSVTLERATLV